MRDLVAGCEGGLRVSCGYLSGGSGGLEVACDAGGITLRIRNGLGMGGIWRAPSGQQTALGGWGTGNPALPESNLRRLCRREVGDLECENQLARQKERERPTLRRGSFGRLGERDDFGCPRGRDGWLCGWERGGANQGRRERLVE